MSAQDHIEYMNGWNLYQFGHSDINVCTSMLQRRGWLDARAAEEAVFMDEAKFAAEYEAALAVGRRYEATGDARVFGW